ncbi:ParB/RepB/Spo0J family partition protein [Aeoliella sp.]|uniref:ParB/RepB/Spo0J family partition protein n=1 Tax=Aeoliella sp. TaxID=2795800 RepID=UPI003CCC2C6B
MAKLISKPTTWFKFDPNQPRKLFEKDDLQLLGESLRVKQIQPVVCNRDGVLIAGERRVRAAIQAELPELLAIISDDPLTDTEVRILQLSENLHRADLNDAEKWHACEELLGLNPDWSNKDLASHLKLSEGTVSKYLAAGKAVPEVQQALEAGEIGITAVYEISRAAAEQQAELLELKRNGTSRDDLASHVRRQKQDDAPQVRMKRILCPLASGVSITASGNELSLDDLIDALGDAQKEARKAREQGLDAKTFSAVMKDKAKKGGA